MRIARLSSLALAISCSAVMARAQVPQIVADTPIAHSLTAQVMGDLGTPALLLERGSNPHNVQLRPSQMRALSSAALVIWTSGALSPWLAEVLASVSPQATLELARVEGTHHQPFHESMLLQDAPDQEASGHDEHGHDDHAHEAQAHDDHEGHTHEGNDPHLWLNPENAQVWLGAIAAQLSAMDPANAATYARNAQEAQAAIDALSQEIAATLAPAQGIGMIVHHNAYGYFADAFNLTVLGSVADGDAVDPGAARIAALRAALDGSSALCVFPEKNHSDAYVGLIAEGNTLRLGEPLDPAGMLLEPGPGLYAQTLRDLAHSIAACATGD